MARRSNVIAVMSPKGGVGKTVTTANLAAALAIEFNKKVLALDTNISTASLGLHFDVFYPKTTLHDVIGKKKIPFQKIIHEYHENLHIIPASIKIKKKERNLRGARKSVEKIVSYYDKLLGDLSKKYDLILLDCAPGFDIEAIAAMEVAGGLLLVTNPDYPSLVTAAKAIQYAKISKMPVGGIVLNKIMGKGYELTSNEIEDALKVKVVERIPFDKKIPKSIANRIPNVLFSPNSKSSKAYKRLAASLIGVKYQPNPIKRFFNYY
jgi:septum site-determining protein MinD